LQSQSRIRSLIFAALGIALLAVSAQIQLPVGPVPFTLQTLALLIIVLALSPGAAIAAVAGYLVLGAIGLPVGAGFKAGAAWLIGPTGGFLFGFLLAAVLVALLRRLTTRQAGQTRQTVPGKPSSARQGLFRDMAFGVLMIIVYDSFGLLWFMFSTKSSLLVALSVAVAPFLIPDLLKLIASVPIFRAVRAALGNGNLRSRADHASR